VVDISIIRLSVKKGANVGVRKKRAKGKTKSTRRTKKTRRRESIAQTVTPRKCYNFTADYNEATNGTYSVVPIPGIFSANRRSGRR
jgi:hypothetical protein